MAALLAVASAASATVAADVVGTSLFQGVGDYNNLPISLAAAKAAGWKAASSACVPNRGVLHYKTDDGFPSVEQPLGIGYTPGGQVC